MSNLDETHTPVRPISTLAGYIGGKRALAKTLVPMIERTPHTLYCEVFMGLGGVFFRRSARPKVEAINDRSQDVATLFRVLQRHYQALMDMLRWQLTSRADYERLAHTDPDTLTDLERSARFLYLQKLSFGGKVAGRTMGIINRHYARISGEQHLVCALWISALRCLAAWPHYTGSESSLYQGARSRAGVYRCRRLQMLRILSYVCA